MEIVMPKPEWGVKHSCTNCGARFYDMLRDPIVCPKCDTEIDVTVIAKPKRIRSGVTAATASKDVDRDEDLIDEEDREAGEDEEEEANIEEPPLDLGEDEEGEEEESEEEEEDELEEEDLEEFEDDVLLEEDEEEDEIEDDDLTKL
jgi:uncharacterized protein (TIGR02300 family)